MSPNQPAPGQRDRGADRVSPLDRRTFLGTAAAVANAADHATGVRIRELPIRIEKLL